MNVDTKLLWFFLRCGGGGDGGGGCWKETKAVLSNSYTAVENDTRSKITVQNRAVCSNAGTLANGNVGTKVGEGSDLRCVVNCCGRVDDGGGMDVGMDVGRSACGGGGGEGGGNKEGEVVVVRVVV